MTNVVKGCGEQVVQSCGDGGVLEGKSWMSTGDAADRTRYGDRKSEVLEKIARDRDEGRGSTVDYGGRAGEKRSSVQSKNWYVSDTGFRGRWEPLWGKVEETADRTEGGWRRTKMEGVKKRARSDGLKRGGEMLEEWRSGGVEDYWG